jgi:hypothetical protein
MRALNGASVVGTGAGLWPSDMGSVVACTEAWGITDEEMTGDAAASSLDEDSKAWWGEGDMATVGFCESTVSM